MQQGPPLLRVKLLRAHRAHWIATSNCMGESSRPLEERAVFTDRAEYAGALVTRVRRVVAGTGAFDSEWPRHHALPQAGNGESRPTHSR